MAIFKGSGVKKLVGAQRIEADHLEVSPTNSVALFMKTAGMGKQTVAAVVLADGVTICREDVLQN